MWPPTMIMKVQAVLFGAGLLSTLLPTSFAASFCSGQPLCCPRAGLGGRFLQLQQTNEQTLCTYGIGQDLRHCTYNTFSTEMLSTTKDCPTRLEQGSTTSPYCFVRQELRSGWDWDKCIEAPGGAGSDPQLHNCQSKQNQGLILYSGADTQIHVAGTDLCLDAGSAPGPGTVVKVQKCSIWDLGNQDSKQLWRYDPTLFHISHLASNLFLSVRGTGQQLDLQPLSTDAKQIWRTYK